MAGKSAGIVFAIGYYPPIIGGAEKKAQRLAEELVRLGERVFVITKWKPGLPRTAEEKGVSVIRTGNARRACISSLIHFYLNLFFELWKLRGEYVIIHNFLFSTVTLVCILSGFLFNKRVIISPGGTGRYGGLFDKTGLGRLAFFKRFILFRSGAEFIASSRESEEELKDAGVPDGRIHLLPNPVDTLKFASAGEEEKRSAREKLGLNGKVFLFAGRLVEQKAPERLVAAWPAVVQRFPEAKLVLTGAGEEENRLKSAVVTAGLQACVFVRGAESDLIPFYNASDFFVLPSRGEGMSNALLEAMSCGLPAIVSEVSGTSMVKENETGFRVKNADDPRIWEDAVNRACALSPQDRTRMSNAAREAMVKNHNIEAVCRRLLEVYRD